MTSAGSFGDHGASKPEPLMYPNFTGRNPLELAASVVPVLRNRNGQIAGCGTAFFVSNDGVLFTAGHVVAANFEGQVKNGIFHGEPGDIYFVAVPGGDSPGELGHLVGVRVEYIAFEPRLSDVAVLRADMSSYPPSTRAHLQAWSLAHFRPVPGEECVVMGYADMRLGDPILTDAANPDFTWTHRLAFEEGEVEELHPAGRDDGAAPYPCFSIGLATSGGMSGGPVFTKDGLVGVIS
ncbi:MAG: S1 family peptidase, partial [Acidimicrobiales bacterium]